MMQLPGTLTLAHLNLDVADLARSQTFYADVLRLPVVRRSDSLLVYWPGGLLVLAPGTASAAGSFHFGFRAESVSAVDAWFDHFIACRAPIREHPVERGAVYVGRISDPDDYPIEIYAEVEAAAPSAEPSQGTSAVRAALPSV